MKGGRSDPRNATLHQMFSYLGYGERAGSGLYMISTVWKDKNWISPEMKDELNPNRTILTLYMRNDKKCYNNYHNRLNGIQLQIIGMIKENPNITQNEMAKVLNTTNYIVKNNIVSLRKMNVIKRIGSNKSGEWMIIK